MNFTQVSFPHTLNLLDGLPSLIERNQGYPELVFKAVCQITFI